MKRKSANKVVRNILWVAACALLGAAGCDKDRATGPQGPVGGESSQEVTQAEAWGIRVISLRPTLGGTLVDLRFKVIDPEKAKPLFDRSVKPTLFDPATNTALGMPDDTKLGALRAGLRNPPMAGKLYFVLFANGYGTVKRGSRVNVSLGDFKLDNIVVD